MAGELASTSDPGGVLAVVRRFVQGASITSSPPCGLVLFCLCADETGSAAAIRVFTVRCLAANSMDQNGGDVTTRTWALHRGARLIFTAFPEIAVEVCTAPAPFYIEPVAGSVAPCLLGSHPPGLPYLTCRS
jgi:hypothetical protein